MKGYVFDPMLNNIVEISKNWTWSLFRIFVLNLCAIIIFACSKKKFEKDRILKPLRTRFTKEKRFFKTPFSRND